MSDTANTPETEGGREPAAMSVRGAAVWAMAGQYISFAIQFCSSVVISRFFLSPAEVGLFSIGLAAALLVSILQDFGLSRYLAAQPTLSREEIARCSSVAFLFSFVIASLIAAAAYPMAQAYHQPALMKILLIISASYLFLPLAVVPMALMARSMQFHRHFAVNVGGALVQATVAVSLAWAGSSSFALAWATVGSAVARGLIAQAMRRAPPWPLRLDGVKPVLAFGSRSSLLYFTGALGTRSPDLIVGKMLTMAAVGLYSRAVSLSDQFRMLIAGAIGSVFFPAFARIRDRGEPLGPAYLRVCSGYTAIVWPGMAGLAFAAQPLVHLLYGPAWSGVAPLLQWIALSELLFIAMPLNTDLPILMGRMDKLMVFCVIDTVMSLALLAGGAHWGVQGAAISRMAYAVGYVALYARFMHEITQFDVKIMAGIYARSFVAMLAALAPLAATYLFWQSPDQIALPVLLGAVAVGVALWLVALVLLRHPVVNELEGLAEKVPLLRRVVRA
ncbi:oligosaccharide flippase family protein [Novosphingobium terrae]|uniref:oligosaccharide flippase family protein n=1 Tax=Novosphingobium terrae TaxID=2726189 RepID=UPI001F13DC38|nr:oligosaccharide flippase family protein [Novosphingobium terrae]